MAPLNNSLRRFMETASSTPDVPEEGEPFSVGQLMSCADVALQESGPGECWIEGTLASWRQAERWITAEVLEYTSDGRQLLARVSVGMSPAVLRAQQLSSKAMPADGQRVRLRGRLEISYKYKPLRFLAREMVVFDTTSANSRHQSELVESLEREGVIEQNRSLACPEAPTRVGLLHASSISAGREDFVANIEQADVRVIVNEYGVPMQGADALEAIPEGLERLVVMGAEVIVIARGGGPSSDFAAFNAEPVVRAVASCPVPVVLAVGHTTDSSLADRVAFRSVPTPTGAAQWVVERHRQVADRTLHAQLRQPSQQLRVQLDDKERQVQRLRRTLAAVVAGLLFVVVVLAMLLTM